MSASPRTVLAALLGAAGLALAPGAVARAAAPGAQEDSVRQLARTIAKEKDAVDPEVFERLARIGGKASFEALRRALRDVSDDALRAAAYAAFASYREDEDLAPASVELLSDEAQEAEQEAWRRAATRALPAFGDRALEALDDIVLRHRDPECRAIACDVLVPWYGERGGEAGLRAILENASLQQVSGLPYLRLEPRERAALEGRVHREIVRAILARGLAQHRPLLAQRLDARDASRVWKLLIVRLFHDDPAAESTAALARACANRDPAVALLAVELLVARRDFEGRAAALRPLIDSAEPALRRASIAALGEILARDPGFQAELRELARSPDPVARMGAAVGLSYAHRAGNPRALDALHALLADPEWPVRVEALRRVLDARDGRSVPLLIERLDAETGRVARDVHAILVALTGVDRGRLAQAWRHWWEREGPRFEPVDAAGVRRVAVEPDDGPASEVAARFYELRVHSERVAFVLDVSGSMRNPSTSGQGTVEKSRMDVAKEELTEVLRRLPDGTMFNVIFFESQVRALEKELVVMKPAARQKALRFVREQYSLGGTALYPALELAFADTLVDTVYLLSDGAPTEGAITDIEEIRAEVARWNATRHVRVHGVAMGQDSTLLRWLCEDTGGRYVRVD